MKRCESSGTFRICAEAFFAHSRRRRRRSNLPIAAVAAAGWLPHISGARGGGRSPSRHQNNERGPTQRETLKHLFGITGIAASQEVSIRRTPPFKTTSVADGRALMLHVGVIRKVVTSSSEMQRAPGGESRSPLVDSLNDEVPSRCYGPTAAVGRPSSRSFSIIAANCASVPVSQFGPQHWAIDQS